MKTLSLTFCLITMLVMACKKIEHKTDSSLKHQTTPVKSINGYKNGKPFINYLGSELDGC